MTLRCIRIPRALAAVAGLLLAAGCTVGTTASRVYQAEGVTLTLDVGRGTVTGELLAVEPAAFLVDAVSSLGTPTRVVRVPVEAIRRGAVYARPARPTLNPAFGRREARTRRIARLQPGGIVSGGLDLRTLSRFPHGLDDAVLATLLSHRGQTEVAPYTDTLLSTP